MRIAITLCCGLLFACGSTPRPRPSDVTGPPPHVAEPVEAGDESEPVTEAECRALIDHTVDIGTREMAPSERPDPAAQKEVRATLAAELLPQCLEEVSRAQLECALAATTSAALTACGS